jgi:hypothetical protein
MLNFKVCGYTHTLLGRDDIRKFSNLKANQGFLENKKPAYKAGFL